MGFLKKLFGGKGESTAMDPREDPNVVRVFDELGREFFITKAEWRKTVLPDTLQARWNDADALYVVVRSALRDGFAADVVEAARHLQTIDPMPERSACLCGIVLTKVDRLDEAEAVFRGYLAKHGESGVVLTNLAKVHAQRGDAAKADETLWRALETDPNQDNACAWFVARQRERSGDEARLAAWRRIAALPNSWRANLWLARAALEAKRLDEALGLYRETLTRAPRPVPIDVLVQTSGDLGRAGFPAELLSLVEPLFDASVHGLAVGNNLIKANLGTGRVVAARAILEQLFVQKRPDWNDTLGFWDTELAKTQIGGPIAADPATPLKMTMLAIDGPVWLEASSPATELFPAKAPDAPVIAFLGATATTPDAPLEIRSQLTDGPGRLSRALPLYLAERTHLETQVHARTLIPWMLEPRGGFILTDGAWPPLEAAGRAKSGAPPATFVVTAHILADAEPWKVDLTLVRVADGAVVEKLSAEFPSQSPQAGVPALARQMVSLLERRALAARQAPITSVEPPEDAQLSAYLLRLEQLLAVRCANMEKSQAGFLHGQREILDGNIRLCADCPQSVNARLLLAETVAAMRIVRPDIVAEFEDKLAKLSARHPLPGAANELVARILRPPRPDA